ncbi:MAG TPA: helix-turn-helix domain-containing protein, partial [Polyangia bacterium]
AAAVENVLSEGGTGPTMIDLADGRGMAASIEAHLARYFATFGDDLPPDGLYDRVLAELERPLLTLSLLATGGNQIRAAKLLGINRNTLRKKLNDLRIDASQLRGTR